MKNKICHFTISHNTYDERIFHKECNSLKNNYDVVLVTTADKNFIQNNISVIGIGKNKGTIHRFLRIFTIIPKLLSIKAKTYHFHDPELIITGFLLKLIFRKKVIYDVHEDYGASLKTYGFNKTIVSIWNKMELKLSSFFDLIIVVDSHLKTKFKKLAPILIGNYPFLSFITEKKERKQSDKVFKLVYLGTIHEDRGLITAIEVVEKITKFKVELHIIGESRYPELTKKFNDSEKVVYHGRIPWENLKKELIKYDLGLILLKPVPAYTYSTGENIVKLFEYAAVGMPYLISNFTAISEFINKNGGGGILVNPINVEEIAAKVEKIIQDTEQYNKLSKEAIDFVKNKYNWDIQEEILINAYDKLLKK